LKKWDAHAKAESFTPRNDLPTNRRVYGYLPIALWLFSYNKGCLRPDLIAGLTTAAVVIPTIAILTASNLGQVVSGGDAADLMRASATLTLLVGAILVFGVGAAPRFRRELHF
jgi:MFS superfamily sulfate permease-like transporter